MISSLPPALLFLGKRRPGAAAAPGHQAGLHAGPAPGRAVRDLADPPGHLLVLQLPGHADRALEAGSPEPGVRLHLPYHLGDRHVVRPQGGRRPATQRGPGLCRRRVGGHPGGRLVQPLRVLGNHGRGLHLPHPGQPHSGRPAGRLPLHPGASVRRVAAPGGHRAQPGPRRGHRHRRAEAGGRGRLANLPGHRPQRGHPAPAPLAERRLSRGHPHRRGVPERLYHQERGVHHVPGVRRGRGPHLGGGHHDHLPHLLRGAGERHPPGALLQPDEPGGLHDVRHRHRHHPGSQRHGEPRLLPHSVQSSVVHGRGQRASP